MAAASVLSRTALPPRGLDGVSAVRLAAVVAFLLIWYGCAVSGLLFRDVVPTPWRVLVALANTLATPGFYTELLVTCTELIVAILIGGGCAVMVGTVLGHSDFAARAYEPWIHYIGLTPKIIFFPVFLMLCGVGPPSKVALGAVSCFFPLALAIAAAIRGVDPVLLRVGRSFNLTRWQTMLHIYLPAIRPALINAFRLVFAATAVGVLLAETKIAQRGLGFLVIGAYQRFDMPGMYALLILVVCMVTGTNVVMQRLNRNHGG